MSIKNTTGTALAERELFMHKTSTIVNYIRLIHLPLKNICLNSRIISKVLGLHYTGQNNSTDGGPF